MTDKLEKQKRKAAKLTNPKPVLRPSGKWRCQVMYKGKRYSVEEDDPEIAHTKALAIKNGIIEEEKKEKTNGMTVGEAIDRYIESKDCVLSPCTILNYKRYRKNHFQDLKNVRLSELTQEQVQRSINKLSKTKSPKTVRNIHGLLSAAVAAYKPDMILRTTLPQKKRYDVHIPSSEEISKILECSKGTYMELPILLALWLGLRQSEIKGITWDCIEGNILHIKQAIVPGEEGPTLKGVKTFSGDRKIRMPDYIVHLFEKRPHDGDFVFTYRWNEIYMGFTRLCEKNNIPHFRFHDLRHANASVMLSLGIPDKYAMERMGHATNNMLKTVYQHTMDDKKSQIDDAIDDYFCSKITPEFTPKKSKTL